MIVLSAAFVVLVSTLALVAPEIQDPLSDEFINLINSKQNSWKAGRNFPPDTPMSYIKKLMGVLKDDNFPGLPMIKHDAELIASLPETFDPTDKWPNCPSLKEIRDQGACGSCWVFGAVEAMTDRYCIYSNGSKQFHFSAQDVLSCLNNDGCHGNYPQVAWDFWKENGIVSGGNYNSSQGCRPYEIAACEHHNVTGKLKPCGKIADTPECVKKCVSNYNVDYNNDMRRGRIVYTVENDEDQIKAELFKNGPVEASFFIYSDFLHYRVGVYHHVDGKFVGAHAVKILGWGVEDGKKYWHVANSWNEDWGNKGYFKILRGINHCGIEDDIIAGEPIIE